MSFKEEINIENNKITITVSCEKRKYSFEQKLVYQKKVKELIPGEFTSQVRLVKSPNKIVANLNDNRYTNKGIWIFELVSEKTTTKEKEEQEPKIETSPAQTRKPRTRKPRTRNKKD